MSTMDTSTTAPLDLANSAGLRIRDLRTKLGYSQEEVADRASINVLTLSNIERGTSDPRLGTVRRIAQALELPTAALLP
jgi:transcriptional regulator with XRE-family HTH domain